MQKQNAPKRSSRTAVKKTRIIDNPLLRSTMKTRREQQSDPAEDMKQKLGSVRDEADTPRGMMSTEEEKVSVFEIISDLEKQLDAAFSIKDAQEDEIIQLKTALEETQQDAASLDAKVREVESTLVSQEELNSELEFLENDRLEASEKIRALEKQVEEKDMAMRAAEDRVESMNKEVEVRDTRIDQIELELNSSGSTIQNFQNQITLLEDEKEALSDKLGGSEEEYSKVIQERDKFKRELQRAKESLDEIRLMLADTRSRAREHYYKKKPRK